MSVKCFPEQSVSLPPSILPSFLKDCLPFPSSPSLLALCSGRSGDFGHIRKDFKTNVCLYHAELGLQLDLQALECAPQVIDLCLGCLDYFCANGHLFAES